MEIHKLFCRMSLAQISEVMDQDRCELDATFLGFTEVYEHLAEIIPKHFAVVDLGCYCAAQAYFFENHRAYYGVDVFEGKRFRTPNTAHYTKSIQRFIAEDMHSLDLEETFAICSYVPDLEAQRMARAAFTNLFVYYPSNKHGTRLCTVQAADMTIAVTSERVVAAC